MSEIRDPMGRLHLIGYEKLTDHGLALPVFGRSPGANVFYTARSTLPGEAGGLIAEFDRYDPAALVPLPLEQTRETGVGEHWLDVFLWEDTAHVGTAPQIWNALAEARATIEQHAPLSLLVLAEGIPRAEANQLAHKAFSWLTRRYGRPKALEWRRDTYLRNIVCKTLRRELGASASKAEIRVAFQEQLIIREEGNKIRVFLGSPFYLLGQEHFDAFAEICASFGLEAEFIVQEVAVMQPPVTARGKRAVRRRTSENEMRIAALRVAASKPRGTATTTELKDEVNQYVDLTPEDLTPSKTRPNEAMYQQVVGNIVSHRESGNNIFANGWAIYTGNGIQITDAGRQHLRTLGLQY